VLAIRVVLKANAFGRHVMSELTQGGLTGYSDKWRLIAPPLVIIGITFLVGYVYSSRFGLYEDDYIWVMTLQPMRWSAHELHTQMNYIWAQWGLFYQGRPLGFSINAILAFLGGKLPSIGWQYLFAMAVQSLNGILLYRVHRKVLPTSVALAGALAFVCFPADTSRMILMHRMLTVATCFVLLAIWLLQTRHYLLAYAAAAISLTIYEAPFLAFLVAPILCPDWGRSRIWFWVRHIIIFFAIAVCFLLLRRVSGDDRAASVLGGTGDLALRVVAACAIGFFVTLRAAFVDSWINVLRFFQWQYILLGCLGGVMAYRTLITAKSDIAGGITNRVAGLTIGGLVGIAFAHCLCFRAEYFPPTEIYGRLSALHVGAAIPWAMLVAGLSLWALQTFPSQRLGVFIAISALLALWITYGIVFQDQGMAKSWSQQKEVWNQVIRISGRLQDNDLLVVDMQGAPSALGFSMIGFLDSRSQAGLGAFVRFPKGWKTPPRLVGCAPWLVSARGPGEVALKTVAWAPPEQSAILRNGSFYFFRWVKGELVPVEAPIELAGVTLTPKRIDMTPLPAFATTHAYKEIFGD
jgi:hypothetical protein